MSTGGSFVFGCPYSLGCATRIYGLWTVAMRHIELWVDEAKGHLMPFEWTEMHVLAGRHGRMACCC